MLHLLLSFLVLLIVIALILRYHMAIFVALFAIFGTLYLAFWAGVIVLAWYTVPDLVILIGAILLIGALINQLWILWKLRRAEAELRHRFPHL